MENRKVFMSYYRISDGVNTFTSSNDQVLSEPIPSVDTHLQMPISFLRCPNCESEKIGYMCDCFPENYRCPQCDWTYITHEHPPEKKDNFVSRIGNNLDIRSVLAGAIRN